MGYKDVGIVILAAGKGTRMKSDMAKVLHKVAGKSMIVHVIECARKIARDNIHVVVGYQAEQVKNEINRWFKVKFALQPRLLGTGDAVKSALPGMMPHIKDVLVLCGDVPLIQEKTLRKLIDGHKKSQAKLTVLATDVEDPSGYGRIVLGKNNHLLCIKEEADASAAEKKINRVNTGIYCFDKALLMSIIDDIKPDNRQAEYYLTDGVEIAQKKGESILVLTMDDPREVVGVNTLEGLVKAESFIQQLGK
ncbi:sugar phosphate nucleotidyltransferase [Desulfobacula sp.]|uniref:sugar phosphate nucleotidyltransferase n=1 Tax=Desulfobacula sp. TaxID=2593537 RepID=UPI002615D733|nr:sugar phosphate nucleotidyltransferase [Desulfobacula sp.]